MIATIVVNNIEIKKHQQNADAFKIARFALTLMIDTTNCHHIIATTVVAKED